jgi:hypothetical protein
MRRPAFLALLTLHLDSAEPAYPSEFRMPSCIVSVTLKRGMRGVCIDANDRKINTL